MAAPIFSYAQAAKGLTPTSTIQAAATEPTVSDAPTKEATRNVASTPSPSTKPQNSKAEVISTSATDSQAETPDTPSQQPTEAANLATTESSTTHDDGKVPASPTSPKAATELIEASLSPESQGIVSNAAVETRGPARDAQETTSSEKGQQKFDKEKVRDSEDDWEKVSLPSLAAEKELRAAPIPSVNIWQQRKEAQEAKKREIATQRLPQAVDPASSQKPKGGPAATTGDNRKRTNGKEAQTGDKTSNITKNKSNSGVKTNDRKDGSVAGSTPRSASQSGEKTEIETPPPVGDADSWPTPESVPVDDRRRSSMLEKNDRFEGKSNTQKPHNKQWVQIPFVPTAVFETQLPPRRNILRPNGRPNRSSQSAGNPEKQDATTSMGPPSLPKQSNEPDRGRKPDEARSTRASSAPTDAGRPVGVNSGNSSTRKPSGIGSKETTTGSPVLADNSSRDSVQGENIDVGNQHDSVGSLSQNPAVVDNSAGGQGSTNPDSVTEPAPLYTTQSRGESGSRPGLTSERLRGSISGTRNISDSPKERGPRREWSRDKPESAKEKVESWRDREVSGDTNGRRESRGERGRGGGYRGRGNHNQYASFGSSHAYTTPLPQNGFEMPKTGSMQEPRSRQSSQPYVASQAPSGNRNTSRSQSIPSPMMFPGYFQPNVSQSLSPSQTDMTMYGYGPQMSMQPGIMNAMPYNDTLNSYAMLSMVMTQVEYYFSIDNLCKDLFLRRHMDSQGFVPLSIIANFQRIKTMTEDNMTMDTLRQVCQRVESIEYVQGPDGEDRLRRREGWKDFVLPMEDRHPSARNDGPNLGDYHTHRFYDAEQMRAAEFNYFGNPARNQMMQMPSLNGQYQAMSAYPHTDAESFGGQIMDRMFTSQNDSMRGELPKKSPATSPFSHETAPTSTRESHSHERSASHQINGQSLHLTKTETAENVFSDERVGDLYLFLKDSGDGVPNATAAESRDPVSARVSGLRGGAGSVQRMDRFRGLTFGETPPNIPKQAGTEFYLTKDGEEMPLLPPRPGIQCHPYPRLHDEIIKDRYETGNPAVLEPLYNFWSNFLVDNFNISMYEEFKNLAQKDSQDGSQSGTQHLQLLFNKLLNAHQPMTERTATDLVNLARESWKTRGPLFQMLRAAWRNGATNLKTRKRLGDVLSAEEKAEFDRGG